MNDTPRIYVACLASYNAGILHGRWIDATDAEVIHEGIEDMLSESQEPIPEEWAIHDYEGFGRHCRFLRNPRFRGSAPG